MNPAIRFAHVSKRYQLGITRVSVPTLVADKCRRLILRGPEPRRNNQTLWALRDVSFELALGECLALIGPNGAGKTTVLRLLSQISKPTEGSITTTGRLSALLELGAGFHPDLTGRENIYLNAAILGLSKTYIQRRFDDIVAFSGLERFIDTPIKRYSSGMTVRLGFSVASSVQPDILLIDEVLAVGDASFRQRCVERIRKLVNDGTALIFVSHNLYMVQAICSRALYLQHGQVHASGATKDVIEDYERSLHEARTANVFQSPEALTTPEHDIEITEVRVSGEHTRAHSGVLLSTQPALITVAYWSAGEVGPVQMSLFIKRADGLTCCMMRTSANGHRLRLKRGLGVLSIRLERLQLITGRYAVQAYFLNESDSVPLTPNGGQSNWFSVKGTTLSYSDDAGVFEPLVVWQDECGPT